ncbi:hypothetical protein VaNZ11_011792 [Volvox africanus]|uniref:Uncharacterized protein n=1 Tax=Volvox africanus TaxID=51714 RepID=A0ABQ5SEF6_9CHLO|nr:hypothetical protein VaNZ11_011792 [Volvox africanus]
MFIHWTVQTRPTRPTRPTSPRPAKVRMATKGTPTTPTSVLPRLWVFDFDWTVVDENSDTWIHRCTPGGSLPPALRNSYVPPDWVGYMNRVLDFLSQKGVTADDLRAQLQVIPWTPGMRQLLEAIADSTHTAPDGAEQQAVAAAAGLSTSGASVGYATASGTAVSNAATDLAVTSAINDYVVGADAKNGFGPPDVVPVLVPVMPPVAGDGAATFQLPATGSPLAAFKEECAEEEEEERKHQEGERVVGDRDSAAVVTKVIRERLGEPQHAVILSDANSLFTPWILDGGGGAAACNGASTCGEASGTYAAPSPMVGTAEKAVTSGTQREGDTTRSSAGGIAALHRQRPLSSAFLSIHTNPAVIDPATGRIRVSPYHGVDPGSVAPPHSCPRCHPNLCKRAALQGLLEEQATRGVLYRQVVYVGDGRNDLCPCLALRPNDVVMARSGFALHKLLAPCITQNASPTGAPGVSATNTTGSGIRDAGKANRGNSGGNSHAGATQREGRGDGHVYGTASGSTLVSMPAAPRQQGQVAPLSVRSAEAGADERLQAACVPWADAYDILRWVCEQEEAAIVDLDRSGGDDLATQVRSLTL